MENEILYILDGILTKCLILHHFKFLYFTRILALPSDSQTFIHALKRGQSLDTYTTIKNILLGTDGLK